MALWLFSVSGGWSVRRCCQVNWFVIWQWPNQTAWGQREIYCLNMFGVTLYECVLSVPDVSLLPGCFPSRLSQHCLSFPFYNSFSLVCVFLPLLLSPFLFFHDPASVFPAFLQSILSFYRISILLSLPSWFVFCFSLCGSQLSFLHMYDLRSMK